MCAINVLCFLENISFLTLGTTLGGQARSADWESARVVSQNTGDRE